MGLALLYVADCLEAYKGEYRIRNEYVKGSLKIASINKTKCERSCLKCFGQLTCLERNKVSVYVKQRIQQIQLEGI